MSDNYRLHVVMGFIILVLALVLIILMFIPVPLPQGIPASPGGSGQILPASQQVSTGRHL